MMKKFGVIFDFNGVIVDDYPIQKQAWDKISSEIRGRPVSDSEMLQKIRGVPTKETISWMSEGDLDEDQANKLALKKEEITRQLYLTSQLYKLNVGFEDFIKELDTHKIPATIATSSNLEMTLFSFKKLGLERWFTFKDIIYNDGKHGGKPGPGPYLLAMHKLDLKPIDCVVFEDSEAGIISAHAAGAGKIIVVGSEERLIMMRNLPGVTQTIHDFKEISLKDLTR